MSETRFFQTKQTVHALPWNGHTGAGLSVALLQYTVIHSNTVIYVYKYI